MNVIYYTDPLCSWSWAFEPSWRRLQWEFGHQLHCRYRMGGMLADWQRYDDPINHVNRPAQMGPQWMHVARTAGVPLNSALWETNPPKSSYPACIAFKAAETFGPRFADAYLRRLREAAMLQARDISHCSELVAVAEQAHVDVKETERIDVSAFAAAIAAPEARAAFLEDLKDARYLEIGRFPSLLLHVPGQMALALTGYRPYAALLEGMAKAAPNLRPIRPIGMDDLRDYVDRWRRVTVYEIANVFQLSPDDALARLERLGLTDACAEISSAASGAPG